MYDHQRQAFLISPAGPVANGGAGWDVEVMKTADQMYRRARFQGRLRRFFRWLLKRPTRLLDLNELPAGKVIGVYEEAHVMPVPVNQIRGSQGRAPDFDVDFAPLKAHNRDRWVGVAVQRLRGEQLPAVELVWAGSAYYVRDGHHRISVARALGQRSIDARVIIWELAPERKSVRADSAVPSWRYAD